MVYSNEYNDKENDAWDNWIYFLWILFISTAVLDHEKIVMGSGILSTVISLYNTENSSELYIFDFSVSTIIQQLEEAFMKEVRLFVTWPTFFSQVFFLIYTHINNLLSKQKYMWSAVYHSYFSSLYFIYLYVTLQGLLFVSRK